MTVPEVWGEKLQPRGILTASGWLGKTLGSGIKDVTRVDRLDGLRLEHLLAEAETTTVVVAAVVFAVVVQRLL